MKQLKVWTQTFSACFNLFQKFYYIIYMSQCFETQGMGSGIFIFLYFNLFRNNSKSGLRHFRLFQFVSVVLLLLAHLSRRLIGELLVYRGIRRPSVVRRLSTFSNDISSRAAGPILLIFHI